MIYGLCGLLIKLLKLFEGEDQEQGSGTHSLQPVRSQIHNHIL